MKNVPYLNPVVNVTKPSAYTSGLNTVQYNAPVNVIPASNAQSGGLSSTLLHGAGGLPFIPKSHTQSAASTRTQQNIGEYGSN